MGIFGEISCGGSGVGESGWHRVLHAFVTWCASLDQSLSQGSHRHLYHQFSRVIRLGPSLTRPDNLAVSAQGFRRGANRVRKQMWWVVSHVFMACARSHFVLVPHVVESYLPARNSTFPLVVRGFTGGKTCACV